MPISATSTGPLDQRCAPLPHLLPHSEARASSHVSQQGIMSAPLDEQAFSLFDVVHFPWEGTDPSSTPLWYDGNLYRGKSQE
jgi:hypothetical protein